MPNACAPLMVAAEIASSIVMLKRRQASPIAACMLSALLLYGLKLVASATAAPASMSARAGAYGRLPYKEAQGINVATVLEQPSPATSSAVAYSRWSMLFKPSATAIFTAGPAPVLVTCIFRP